MLTQHQRRLAFFLACFHILIVAASNYLVQFPIEILGYTATWGAFSFPFIFLATDLTVRLFGARMGRHIIFYAMLPALVVSYVVTVGFQDGVWIGTDHLFTFNLFVFRIAMASFLAYVIGQIMDVLVFNKLRQHRQWWHAPLASAIIGNLMDTFVFFFVAFYKTSSPIHAEKWMEMGTVDYVFKILINIIMFLPLYKVILDWIVKRFKLKMA